MKKFILALLCLAAVFTVASCADNNSNGKVQVSFYHTMGANLRAVLDKYVTEFNNLYPNIEIKNEQIGSYDDVRDNVTTELQSGKQPAIAYCYPDHVASYLRSKKVIDLNTYILSTEEMDVTRFGGQGTVPVGLTQAQIDDFIEGYYQEGSQFGDPNAMYTLPFSKSTEVMYYNKTFFEQHNLTVPQTWNELGALIEQIKTIDPDSIPLGYDSEANWFITMTEQLNTPYTQAVEKIEDRFLFNDPANMEFVKMFSTWAKNGWMTTQKLYGGYTSGLFTSLTPDKKTGKLTRSYISIGSSAGATYQCPEKVNEVFPFEVGIASIPQANAENKKVISQGPSITMLKQKNADANDAAWLFIKFLLTNPNFQAEFSMVSGYVPVLKSTFEVEGYKMFLEGAGYTKDGIAALSAKVCMEQEDYYFTSPAFVGSTFARDEAGNIMSAAFAETSKTGSDFDLFIAELFENAYNKCVTLTR